MTGTQQPSTTMRQNERKKKRDDGCIIKGGYGREKWELELSEGKRKWGVEITNKMNNGKWWIPTRKRINDRHCDRK